MNTFYHRSQKPWAYQVEDETVELNFKMGKGEIESAKVIYGDALGLYIAGKWFRKEEVMVKQAETTFHEIWTGRMKFKSKRFRYAFELKFKNGDTVLVGEIGPLGPKEEINAEGNGFTFSYWQEENFLNTPEWFKHTNWYQIFPDRFAKEGGSEDFVPWSKIKPEAHEFYGGNIQGIIKKLPHIKSLGFSGIYLTPVFESPSAHRYDTTDYFKIAIILGTDEDFQELIDEAHKLGIKVMMDAVYNHIGASSMQWQDVLKNGKSSKYADWFWINDWDYLKQPDDYNGDFEERYPYETFSYAEGMPRLRWANPEVKKYLLDATAKWTKMGIDGWRLDVSFEPSFNFWRDFKRTVTEISPEIAIIGEVWWDSIDFLNGDMWHGVMNYPLRKIIINYLQGAQSIEEKQKFVYRFNDISYQYTPEQQWGMFNLLSSHDTPRLITTLKNDQDKYKLGMRLMFLNPGSTSTYYGEEIGLEGEHDPDNRRPMPWGETRIDFSDFFRELNKDKEELIKHSNIHDRFYAELSDGKITLQNKTVKLIVNNFDVELQIK